ncbi:MAG: alpha-amylase family glycosyl hydrolase [Clostridiaceae bacterium]
MRKIKESKLLSLVDLLENQIDKGDEICYSVPDLWNCFDYKGKEKKTAEGGLLYVNPYRFYHDCIKNYVLKNYDPEKDYSQSVSIMKNSFKEEPGYLGGDWIKKSSIYSMHIRTSTSWDHDRCGELKEQNINGLKETGTFVKSIALLPMLKKIGIDTIYLLPIAEHSLKNKKGEKGSPYAVRNFFKIDPELKDPITGDEFPVEDEFAAFIEACHILDIKVLIDIIPRTCARDNVLIAYHPDWFYWIRTDDIPYYKPPIVPGIGENAKPSHELLPIIYESDDVWNLIRKFTVSPDKYDYEEWCKINEEYAANPSLNILDLIEERIGITTAPAFSDCINDPQPPWDDITFLRLYWDHPAESKAYVNESCPPYILSDTIKGNLFKGDYPNGELWDVLSDLIPFYQKNFGIDGARIDMGHALPSELVQRVISKPRELDKDFAFIAEELMSEGAEEARRCGYNMIIGCGFFLEPRVTDHCTHKFIYDSRFLPVPVYACGETPDTPRLAARFGGERLAKSLTILNHFMPNGVPFINSGLEIYETQPMNTGIDCAQDEKWIRLAPDDPYNGKLAFFDRYQLHWIYANRWDMQNALETVSGIRKEYIETLTDLNNFVPLGVGDLSSPAIALGWRVSNRKSMTEGNLIVVVGNTDMEGRIDVTVDLHEIRRISCNNQREAFQIYSQCIGKRDIHDFDDFGDMRLSLEPGEVKVIRM